MKFIGDKLRMQCHENMVHVYAKVFSINTLNWVCHVLPICCCLKPLVENGSVETNEKYKGSWNLVLYRSFALVTYHFSDENGLFIYFFLSLSCLSAGLRQG